jgi:hypothetical protein
MGGQPGHRASAHSALPSSEDYSACNEALSARCACIEFHAAAERRKGEAGGGEGGGGGGRRGGVHRAGLKKMAQSIATALTTRKCGARSALSSPTPWLSWGAGTRTGLARNRILAVRPSALKTGYARTPPPVRQSDVPQALVAWELLAELGRTPFGGCSVAPPCDSSAPPSPSTPAGTASGGTPTTHANNDG